MKLGGGELILIMNKLPFCVAELELLSTNPTTNTLGVLNELEKIKTECWLHAPHDLQQDIYKVRLKIDA